MIGSQFEAAQGRSIFEGKSQDIRKALVKRAHRRVDNLLSFLMGDNTMLTQLDTLILAGHPSCKAVAGPRSDHDAALCALARERIIDVADRPSRLSILLEPVAQAVVPLRALFGVRKRQSAVRLESHPASGVR